MNDIEVILAIVSIIIAIISIFVSLNANCKSKEANQLSKKANKIAEEANKLIVEQNELSNKALSLSFREGMSEFDIELQEINFDNDYNLMESINEALKGGTAKCTFKIKNRTPYNAYKLGFESHALEEIRLDTQDLYQNEEKNFTTIIQLNKLSKEEPFYNVVIGKERLNKRNYHFYKKIYWENEHKKCECLLRFEIELQEKIKANNNLREIEINTTSNNKVFVCFYNVV